MAGFFDDVAGGNFTGLLADPAFNLGLGLLGAGLSRPQNFGQALTQGMQFADAAAQRQQQAELQRLRVDEARQRIQDRLRQERTGSELASFVDMLAPQAAAQAMPGAGGILPGGAVTSTLGAPPAAAMPGILSQPQADFLRRLAPIAPDFVGTQLGSLLFPPPQQPTNLEREFEFLTSIGVQPERALEALRKGTVVNVAGDAEAPLSVDDIAKVRLPNGQPVPIGTTPSQARTMGAVVVTAAELEKQVSATNALAILDQIEELAIGSGGVLTDLEPGLLNRGAAAFNDTIDLLTQNDPAVAQLESLSTGAGASIVRALGEKGALSDSDVQRALGLLPQTGNLAQLRLPDTRAEATNKLRQLREILERGARNLERLQTAPAGNGAAPPSGDLSAAERAELEQLRQGLGQ